MPTSDSPSVYIPFQPEFGYEKGVALAIAYFQREGLQPIIVAPNKTVLEFVPPLKSFARGRTVITPMNTGRVAGGRGNPALIYAPDLKQLELGLEYARGNPVVVVEDASYSCERWADEANAINLLDRKVHSVERTAEHEEILKAIDWAGNNGWSDAPGKRDLLRHLGKLKAHGWLDRDEIIAYQLVKGRHGHYESLNRLSKLIDDFSG